MLIDDTMLDAVATPPKKRSTALIDDETFIQVAQSLHAKNTASGRKSKGGRPRPPVVPRKEGEKSTFRTELHPSPSVRVLMPNGVRDGTGRKWTVPVPPNLARRLENLAPMNRSSAIGALADWALDRLEDQGQCLYIQAEIVDEAFIPEESLQAVAGKTFEKALAVASKNKEASLTKLAVALDDARFDGAGKTVYINELLNLLEEREKALEQAIELLSPSAYEKAERMGWTNLTKARAIKDDIERKAGKFSLGDRLTIASKTIDDMKD